MQIKNNKFTRRGGVIAAVALTGVALTGCGSGAPSAQSQSIHNDQKASAQALEQLQQAQPTPAYNWSQIRQTLIDIENAQAATTQTTTFFFNQGVQAPIHSCPSIGFPVATTTQLTNPEQIVQKWDGGANQFPTIPQADPTGIYAGSSTGTYVICVAGNGTTYASYWEGFVETVTGPAVWTGNGIKMTGPSTVNFKTKK